MKKLAFLIVMGAFMLSAGIALAQSAFTIPFAPLNNSGVQGDGVLTAVGAGATIALNITGLAPGADASATLNSGSCAASNPTLIRVPILTVDATGVGTASGPLLQKGDEGVALTSVADGQHVVIISQKGQQVACSWIPQVAPTTQPGMPHTGGGDLLPTALALLIAAIIMLGGGLVLRLRPR